MTPQHRTDLDFGTALDSLGEFAPTARPAQPPKAVAESAAEAGFPSREAKTSHQLRGRRTGRDTQFNLKVRADTKEMFCALADANGWGLGETLEKAVALLQREHGAP